MNMRVWKAVVWTLGFMFFDLTLSTLLYIYGYKAKTFIQNLTHFNIFHSMLDLWGLSLLRAIVLLGLAIGICTNSVQGPQRLKKFSIFICVISLSNNVYTIVKMLLYFEVAKSKNDPWFWSLFTWSLFSASVTCFLWQLLSFVTPSIKTKRITSDPYDDLEKRQPLTKNDTENKKRNATSSSATIGRLLFYCRPDANLLIIAFVFLVVAALGEVFTPYYIGLAIDGIVIEKNIEKFSNVLLRLSFLGVGSSFAAGVRGGIFTLTMSRLNVRIRNILFRALTHQEIGFFDSTRTGDIISRLTSDTTIISDIVSQNVNVFLRSALKAAGVCAFMVSLSWQLFIVTCVTFPIILLVSELYGNYYKKLAKKVQDALAEANNIAEETISSMKTVRSFANESEEAELYSEKLKHMYQLNKKQALAFSCFVWCSKIAQLALGVIILFYGGHLIMSGHMSSGNLISFIIYELELGECMENMGSVYTGLMQGAGAAEKVFEFIDRVPTMKQDGTFKLEQIEGHIEFQNVTFEYPTRPGVQVLKDVSFTLRPGEMTALVGPSGSGKSSCVSVLKNFYPLHGGMLLLDGHPVHDYDHRYLHSKVSLVSQEPVLFARTISQNITYGLNTYTHEATVTAAQKSNAHDFIKELPQGYDTVTGEKGTQLSGGQKQRVAIARALIRKPRVLILDEATSALDAQSEHAVQQELSKNMENCTVLIIAHRLSTVEKAHNVIVMEKGCVVEQGTHKELMQKGGLYSKLVQKQILGPGNVPEDSSSSV
ncbi:ABC-type oligopeptide transporter ABCB9 [Protopterus annectens]|uniref:ABC-type oligopeptide transporter ABCB9 n=1 Tax=Protopterus annectens TaxID=7888 RepID=UPI001CFBD9AE|nr:ABC-type oligopeptide transporter ABCB9 [Protopterus annectens]